MIPQIQTDTTRETGDCFRACLASILELPIQMVPNFLKDTVQHGLSRSDSKIVARHWLESNCDASLVCIKVNYEPNPNFRTVIGTADNTLVIASVKSRVWPGEDLESHAVVARMFYKDRTKNIIGFAVVFDPSPIDSYFPGTEIFPKQINLVVPLHPERLGYKYRGYNYVG